MLVDSHCHLDFPEFQEQLPQVLGRMAEAGVGCALCISVTLEGFPGVLELAETHPHLFATVGVHPDYPEAGTIAEDDLVRLADHPRIVAIGETGLDYYRLTGDLEWQRQRFRTHVRAARRARKPLVIHTRAAAEDTLRIMREEGADDVGGVMHCFTETAEVAREAVGMGFCVSFSGIVTFKSAESLRAVARQLPLDRILVETDAPYLAPVPFRGKTNEPAFVRHVAAGVAQARGVDVAVIEAATTENFFRTFAAAKLT